MAGAARGVAYLLRRRATAGEVAKARRRARLQLQHGHLHDGARVQQHLTKIREKGGPMALVQERCRSVQRVGVALLVVVAALQS